MTEQSTRLLAPFQESGSDTPAHLTCTRASSGAIASHSNCRKIRQWTTDLPARLTAHRDGRGARLIEVITAAGIGFRVARTWTGDRTRERQIKRQGGLGRCCPLCGVTPRETRWPA
jgi:hypothetical protein